jgi:hypothetical protein
VTIGGVRAAFAGGGGSTIVGVGATLTGRKGKVRVGCEGKGRGGEGPATTVTGWTIAGVELALSVAGGGMDVTNGIAVRNGVGVERSMDSQGGDFIKETFAFAVHQETDDELQALLTSNTAIRLERRMNSVLTKNLSL